jgi:SAM-dependent MidA family methyltransferase
VVVVEQIAEPGPLRPGSFDIVELGAGKGTLRRTLRRLLPGTARYRRLNY